MKSECDGADGVWWVGYVGRPRRSGLTAAARCVCAGDGVLLSEFKAYSIAAKTWVDYSATLAGGPAARGAAASAAKDDNFFVYGTDNNRVT